MNAHINLQGTAITFEREDIELADGEYAMLADISESVSIPPGRFAMIPTPIWVKGDGTALAILHVKAGRDDDASGPASGQYLIPSTQEQERIVAMVANATKSTIIINPRNSIGFVEFTLLGGEAPAASEEPATATDDGLPISAVYAPEHIDA